MSELLGTYSPSPYFHSRPTRRLHRFTPSPSTSRPRASLSRTSLWWRVSSSDSTPSPAAAAARAPLVGLTSPCSGCSLASAVARNDQTPLQLASLSALTLRTESPA